MSNAFERAHSPDARIDDAHIARRLEEAYTRKNASLQEAAIKPDQFIDLYGQENVQKDKATVERLRGLFEKDLSGKELEEDKTTKRAARVFEGIIYEQSELSDWFGANARTIKTSDFDDFVNGVDLVVEIDEPGRSPGHVALAVDVSFGTVGIEKKISRAVAEIDADSSGTVKYFFSELTGVKGQLLRVPRVVVGVEKKVVAELAGLDTNKRVKELAVHPVQRVIADEVCKQLEVFGKYARSKDKKNAAETYERAYSLMQRTLADKRRMPLDDLAKDRVYERILWQIERVK